MRHRQRDVGFLMRHLDNFDLLDFRGLYYRALETMKL